MEHEKMARFISELRKEKKLTQKELAEQLGVTDKAVSKWERALSCPDISLLAPLAGILGVTASELLNGEQESAPAAPDAIVETTLQYADTVTKSKTKNIRAVVAVILSAALFIGILTCVICDLAISGTLTWSWYVISSAVFLWCAAMPVVLWGIRGVLVTLLAISLLLLPYLFVLERLTGAGGLLFAIGSRAGLVGLVFMWLLFFLLLKSKLKTSTKVAITFLLYIPVDLTVGFILSRYIDQPPINAWDLLGFSVVAITAVLILLIGHLRKK